MTERFIEGGRELDALLQQLAPNVEKNIMRAALRAGAAVFREEARRKLQQNGSVISGLLSKGMRVTTDGRRGNVNASLKASGKHKHIAHWVEYGTAPHRIKAKRKKALSIGGRAVEDVAHPGARDKPFMRPAFDEHADAAIRAVTDKVRERLTLEGLRTPAPEVP